VVRFSSTTAQYYVLMGCCENSKNSSRMVLIYYCTS
jgi:hypothetical protein